MAEKEKVPWLGMSLKDWVTVPLSILALSISAASAYYNLFRQTDDVSLFFNGHAYVERTGDKEALEPKVDDLTIGLINSGNRAALITSITIIFVQGEDNECDGIYWKAFETDFEPVVLKEKDIVSRRVNLTRVEASSGLGPRDDSYTIPVTEKNKAKKKFSVMTCLKVKLATPSVSFHSASVRLFTSELGEDVIPFRDREEMDRPITLIKRTESFFWR